jgi:hypothetical protein
VFKDDELVRVERVRVESLVPKERREGRRPVVVCWVTEEVICGDRVVVFWRHNCHVDGENVIGLVCKLPMDLKSTAVDGVALSLVNVIGACTWHTIEIV